MKQVNWGYNLDVFLTVLYYRMTLC